MRSWPGPGVGMGMVLSCRLGRGVSECGRWCWLYVDGLLLRVVDLARLALRLLHRE